MRRWNALEPEAMVQFARAWLREVRGEAAPDDHRAGNALVMMNFTAPPEQTWSFIVAAVAEATTDDELSHIAAGPVEHLLGWHGEAYVEQVEREAERDIKFARALTGTWRYMMTDAVWARVQAIKSSVAVPLAPQKPK